MIDYVMPCRPSFAYEGHKTTICLLSYLHTVRVFITHAVWLQAIRRMIDKKTVDVYAMFNDELNAIKKELTQKQVSLPASHPKYAGQAHWARMLKRGIERSMMASC